jgi:predicted nucleotidyltransferase
MRREIMDLKGLLGRTQDMLIGGFVWSDPSKTKHVKYTISDWSRLYDDLEEAYLSLEADDNPKDDNLEDLLCYVNELTTQDRNDTYRFEYLLEELKHEYKIYTQKRRLQILLKGNTED